MLLQSLSPIVSMFFCLPRHWRHIFTGRLSGEHLSFLFSRLEANVALAPRSAGMFRRRLQANRLSLTAALGGSIGLLSTDLSVGGVGFT